MIDGRILPFNLQMAASHLLCRKRMIISASLQVIENRTVGIGSISFWGTTKSWVTKLSLLVYGMKRKPAPSAL